MRLLDLSPRLIRRETRVETRRFLRAGADPLNWTEADLEERTGPAEYCVIVDELAAADGVLFLCPKCFQANGGPVGTHSVICWRPRVPPDVDPKPGRWELQGTGLGDVTLVAGSSSVLLDGGCNAHFFVRGGGIEMC